MSISVLGIDPAFRNFGYALGSLETVEDDFIVNDVAEVQLIVTEKAKKKGVRVNSDDFRRARVHSKALSEIVDRHKPRIAFIELPHGSQSASSMKGYGICLGVLAQLRIPIVEVSAEEVKVYTVGTKTATKDEMINWASTRYPDINWLRQGKRLTNANEHLADATAAIHAGLKTDQFDDIRALFALQAA